MPNTYTLLETISVGAAGASSVTFNSIPQTGYTDLVVKVSGRSTYASGTSALLIAVNGLSSVYSSRYLLGNGAAASSGTLAQYVGELDVATNTASTFSSHEIYLPNYASTSQTAKSYSVDSVTENNATTAYANLIAGLITTGASGISSITFTQSAAANFAQHSTFTLYGVSALGTTPTKAPKATGGSIIQTDGTYWYHAFLATGEFKPATALSCDVLVVAGGAGASSGGGGAGGLLAFTSQSLLNNTAYTATVGGGGAGVNMGTQGIRGNNGSNSQFAALTASVGGGGGGGLVSNVNGINGGSGGGGGASSSGGGSGGTATSGQGFAGGTASMVGPNYGSGGGGGAGGVGGNSTTLGNSDTAGAGGVGISTYSSWGSVTQTGQNVSGTFWFAGGGGGAIYGAGGSPTPGTGGNGGGGAGGNVAAGTSATANTGGGGGGAGGSNLGGNGGSGVVIIRYLAG